MSTKKSWNCFSHILHLLNSINISFKCQKEIPYPSNKSISLGINSHKILISNPVINQHLVNFKKESEINSPKTLIMEESLDNLDKVNRTGVDRVVKTVKGKIKVKDGLVIIMVLMDKDGQEIMDKITKAGVAMEE